MDARKTAWIIALSLPIWFAPAWVGAWRTAGNGGSAFASATMGLVLVMVLVAAYTDAKSRLIPNWITYTGILWGIGSNVFQSWLGTEATQQFLGTVGIADSLMGFAILFFGLLVIFSFSGGGAGDVKLTGALGATLGFRVGFEAILISFVCCAVLVLGRTLIKHGPLRLMGYISSQFESKTGGDLLEDPDKKQENPFKASIPLAPFFAIGTIVILLRQVGILEFEILGG